MTSILGLGLEEGDTEGIGEGDALACCDPPHDPTIITTIALMATLVTIDDQSRALNASMS
jgi:hypothetical protein